MMLQHRCLTMVLCLTACTSFQGGRPVESLPTPIPPQQRVEVWSGEETYQLHAVTLDADSVRGVRWWHHPECDSCRAALPRTAVDSVRTLGYDGSGTGLALVLAVPLLILLRLMTLPPGSL